jgi:hypothetical protein
MNLIIIITEDMLMFPILMCRLPIVDMCLLLFMR